MTTLAPPPHHCPGPACTAPVKYSQLACARHWYQVPGPLRRAVYAAWAHGEGAGSPEHNAAMRAAVAAMRP